MAALGAAVTTAAADDRRCGEAKRRRLSRVITVEVVARALSVPMQLPWPFSSRYGLAEGSCLRGAEREGEASRSKTSVFAFAAALTSSTDASVGLACRSGAVGSEDGSESPTLGLSASQPLKFCPAQLLVRILLLLS